MQCDNPMWQNHFFCRLILCQVGSKGHLAMVLPSKTHWFPCHNPMTTKMKWWVAWCRMIFKNLTNGSGWFLVDFWMIHWWFEIFWMMLGKWWICLICLICSHNFEGPTLWMFANTRRRFRFAKFTASACVTLGAAGASSGCDGAKLITNNLGAGTNHIPK